MISLVVVWSTFFKFSQLYLGFVFYDQGIEHTLQNFCLFVFLLLIVQLLFLLYSKKGRVVVLESVKQKVYYGKWLFFKKKITKEFFWGQLSNGEVRAFNTKAGRTRLRAGKRLTYVIKWASDKPRRDNIMRVVNMKTVLVDIALVIFFFGLTQVVRLFV